MLENSFLLQLQFFYCLLRCHYYSLLVDPFLHGRISSYLLKTTTNEGTSSPNPPSSQIPSTYCHATIQTWQHRPTTGYQLIYYHSYTHHERSNDRTIDQIWTGTSSPPTLCTSSFPRLYPKRRRGPACHQPLILIGDQVLDVVLVRCLYRCIVDLGQVPRRRLMLHQGNQI